MNMPVLEMAKPADYDADDLQLNGTFALSSKVGYYRDRVEAWRRGEKVAPITMDVSLTRKCLTPDSLVSMADGSSKRIADIHSGDRVLSFDGESVSESVVLDQWLSSPKRKILSIVTGVNTLKCTADHAILTTTGWKEAGQLCVGDTLVSVQSHEERTEAAKQGGERAVAGLFGGVQRERPSTWNQVGQALERQEAWANVRRAERDSTVEDLAVSAESRGRGVSRATAATAHSLQQRPGEDQGASVNGDIGEGWRATYGIESDARTVRRGEGDSIRAHERAATERRVPTWTNDRSGKGIDSAEDDWEQLRGRPQVQRREQASGTPPDGGLQSYGRPVCSGEDEADDYGEVREELLLGSHAESQQVGVGSTWVSVFPQLDRTEASSDCGETRRAIRGGRQRLDSENPKWHPPQPGFYIRPLPKQDSLASSRNLLAQGQGRCRSGDSRLPLQRLESADRLDERDSSENVADDRYLGQVVFARVQEVREAGVSAVHDLECYPHHNFVANGIVVHNCQASCHFCFAMTQASEGEEPTKEQWFQFLSDIAEIGVKGVSFISDGESTLVPWYADAVEHAANCGLAVGAGSNGIKLTRNVLERVLPHLSYLRFNFSAGERKRYAEIMGLQQRYFDIVIENIRDGMEIIRRDNLKCSLNMQMVCHPKDGDQIVPFAKLVCELRPVYGIVKHCSDDDEGVIGVDYGKYPALYEGMKEAERLGKEAGVRIAVKWDKIKTGRLRDYDRCYGPSFIMQVSGNGLVTSCGMKFNEKHKALHIGSIARTRFKDLFYSKRWDAVMGYLGSEHFNPQCRCGTLCLQHETNRVLFEYVNGRYDLPTDAPPPDIAFI